MYGIALMHKPTFILMCIRLCGRPAKQVPMLTHFAKIRAESLADELVTVLVVVVLHVDLSCQACAFMHTRITCGQW